MNKLAHWLVSLYPAAWRDRYAAEFHTLLDDMNVQPRDLVNIVWAAAKAQSAIGRAGMIVAVAGFAGLLIGAGISLRMPDLYVATGKLRGAASGSTAIAESLSRGFLAGTIRRRDLYRAERVRMPMEDVVELMRREIRIAVSTDTVTVSFAYPDREAARQAALDLMRHVAEIGRVRSLPGAGPLVISEPPGWHEEVRAPPRTTAAACGLLAGLLLGVLAVVVRRYPLRLTLRVSASGAAGAAMAAALSFVAADRYTSTALVRVQPEAVETVRSALTPESLSRLVAGEHLYSGQAKADALNTLKHRVVIVRNPATPGSAELVRVSFTHSEPLQTMRTLNAIIDIWLGATGNPIYARTRPLEVIDRPSFPEAPAGPNRVHVTLIGLAVGMGFVPLRQRLRRTA